MPRRRPVRAQRTDLAEVERALAHWSRFVHGPRRLIVLHELGVGCLPCCERESADWNRSLLKLALHTLPAKAARQLFHRIRPLDELYLARSVPTYDNAELRAMLTVQ